MDPFIEGDEWESFHSRFIAGISDALVLRLRPNYLVRTERRVYVEHSYEEPRTTRPDLAIVRARQDRGRRSNTASTTAVLEPVECTLPGPVEVREKYLVIRRVKSSEVVTVIEVLSPGNKREGGRGREEYLAKRDEILQSKTNLIEIDLLRGGARLPTIEPLPPADYYAFVCRAKRRLRADVYGWSLQRSLPTIPVPLAPGDPEPPLDLQAVFNDVYDHVGYDYSLNYHRALTPPLEKADSKWVHHLLKARK
jgi:hypothetical protein